MSTNKCTNNVQNKRKVYAGPRTLRAANGEGVAPPTSSQQAAKAVKLETCLTGRVGTTEHPNHIGTMTSRHDKIVNGQLQFPQIIGHNPDFIGTSGRRDGET